MQKYTYHWEVKDLLTQFLQAFDGAIVKRYTNERTAGATFGVRYVYSPKQRVLHDLVNKAQHITLPAVAFWITSISRDQSRVFNKLYGQYWNSGGNAAYNSSSSEHNLQPVPINIEVSVSILTKFQSDMDQILSNFVPYSDPYFIISWTREGMPGVEIRSEVLWNGNLAMTYPVEQQSNQTARVLCDTTFTIKGWIFKYDANPVGRIFKIDTNFNPVSGTPTLQNIDYLTDPELTESFVVSAVPQIPYSNRWLATIGASGSVELYGNMLDYTNSIYLSGNNSMFGTTYTINPFLTSKSLSAGYPALSGVIPAFNYTIQNDNKLTVTYPAPSATGFFDIIVINDAGYTKLSVDSYNPNLSTQYPYISGIQVLPISGAPQPSPSISVTPSPTATVTPSISVTPAPTPSVTTSGPVATPSVTPTVTPTPSITSTPAITPSPSPSSAPGFTTGPFTFDFDYMVCEYFFTDGVDMDTMTYISNPAIMNNDFGNQLPGDYVGTCAYSSNGPQFPNDGINNPYLVYGGDNNGTGTESVLFDLNEFKAQQPGVTNIELSFTAIWYSLSGSNPVKIRTTLWKGGTPVQDGYTFINPTATNTYAAESDGTVISTVTQDCLAFDLVTKFQYNLTTKNGQFT